MHEFVCVCACMCAGNGKAAGEGCMGVHVRVHVRMHVLEIRVEMLTAEEVSREEEKGS